ncbi:conserved hypothetical protein [Vibrio nigripulchritudo FTn2]|uniref:antirestriction protein n=1 Tax=Vibrio nigripulchritudo TaxID=28173 RepID=UPI0003B23B0E|nr:antirestriction protein [Vibrio nigripulchritudo]CCN39751.1 conserved hypothetical protein [Vibrio nigripulchritudo FTn2]
MITEPILDNKVREHFFSTITTQYVHFELALYYFAGSLFAEYPGTVWRCVYLDNGGRFLYPDRGREITITKENVTVTLDERLAGIVATMTTISYYSLEAYGRSDDKEVESLGTLYSLLLDHVKTLPESNLILSVLD